MAEPNPRPEPLPPFEPHPFQEEIIDDWRWIYEHRDKKTFNEYVGKWVAIVDKKIYASCRDPEFLEQYVVEKYNLNPERVVIWLVD